MADKKDEKPKETLCHISICVADNGYQVECSYDMEQSLSARAGWVPPSYCKPKKLVAKGKADLLKQLESVL